ncbi:MAG: hypothetical protein ACI9YH_000781 [Colwellia sp.]
MLYFYNEYNSLAINIRWFKKTSLFTLLYLSVFHIQAQGENLEIIEVTTQFKHETVKQKSAELRWTSQ